MLFAFLILRHGYRSIFLRGFFLIIYRDNIYVKILPKPRELSIWPLLERDVGKNRFHYCMYIITKYIAIFKLQSIVG